jgi:hypothetical protein
MEQGFEKRTYCQGDSGKAALKRLSFNPFQARNDELARVSGFRGQIVRDFHKKFRLNIVGF